MPSLSALLHLSKEILTSVYASVNIVSYVFVVLAVCKMYVHWYENKNKAMISTLYLNYTMY